MVRLRRHRLLGLRAAETLNGDVQPMVAISIAKQRGTNAVKVAEQLHSTMAELQRELIPEQVQVQTIRDYGVTANEKVTNLGGSLIFAVLTVVAFIGLFLGWRAAVIVALAVPVCYGMTLALDLVFDYTINRVTLFALILSLGLLVDDPITGVDNITRKLQDGRGSVSERIVAAIAEIKVPATNVDGDDCIGLSAACVYYRHDGALHGAYGL